MILGAARTHIKANEHCDLTNSYKIISRIIQLRFFFFVFQYWGTSLRRLFPCVAKITNKKSGQIKWCDNRVW